MPVCWFENCDELVLVQTSSHSALEMLRHANIIDGVSELLRIWILRLVGWLVVKLPNVILNNVILFLDCRLKQLQHQIDLL